MGSLFGGSRIKTTSTLSPVQQGVMDRLGAIFGSELNRPSSASESILSLLTGNNRAFNSDTNALFQKSFAEPAMFNFDKYVKPRINDGFSKIGGLQSSRRGQAIADALTETNLGIQSNFASLLPQLFNAQLSGISQAEALRYMPLQEAIKFALSPTVAANEKRNSTIGTDLLGLGVTGLAYGLSGGKK